MRNLGAMQSSPPGRLLMVTMDLRTFTDLLNTHYLQTFNAILVGGCEEPFYEAAKNGQPASIRFTRDYIRSAMHERAHWCIAGNTRRRQDDYGYWYAPDGRTQAQQEAFYRVEVRPQAIEWAFAMVCGVPFEVSMDNLDNTVHGSASFEQQVRKQVAHHLERGFPQRAGQILALLHDHAAVDGRPVTNYLREQYYRQHIDNHFLLEPLFATLRCEKPPNSHIVVLQRTWPRACKIDRSVLEFCRCWIRLDESSRVKERHTTPSPQADLLSGFLEDCLVAWVKRNAQEEIVSTQLHKR